MARKPIPNFGSQRVFLAQLDSNDLTNRREVSFNQDFTLVRNAKELEVYIPQRSQDEDVEGGDQSRLDQEALLSKKRWCRLVIGNAKKRAELRRELSQLSDQRDIVGTDKSLVLFRLTDLETLSVELKIIRLAREEDLGYDCLDLVMPSSCFSSIKGDDEAITERNAHRLSLCHTLPGRSGFYIFGSDVFSGLERSRLQDFGIFSNPTRHTKFHLIRCQISEDQSHLNALSATVVHNPQEAAVTVLIKVNHSDQVKTHESNSGVSALSGSLSKLHPPKSLILESWLTYRGMELDLENKRLAERAQSIGYNNLNSRGLSWQVRIRTSPEVLKSWFPKQEKKTHFKLEPPQMILLTKRGEKSEKMEKVSPKAELTEVRNYQPKEGLATFIMKARKKTKKPEIEGELHAIKDHGDSTQRSRREEANNQLKSRNIANPNMLNWLMSPEMARPPCEPNSTISI